MYPREGFGNSFSHPPYQSRHLAAEPSPGLPGQGQTPSTKPGAAQQGGKALPYVPTEHGHQGWTPHLPRMKPGSASSTGVTPPLPPLRPCSRSTRTGSSLQRTLSERCEQGAAPASLPLPLLGRTGASGHREKASGSPG